MRIIAVEAGDFEGWAELYAGYAAFYAVEQSEAMRETVWGWLMDPGHGTEGLVAEHDGRLIGLAHFRAYPRPVTASLGGFLDDLFVDPAARGGGVASGLIEAVAGVGRARGWLLIRWITADDNTVARSVYDRVAVAKPWVTYDMKL